MKLFVVLVLIVAGASVEGRPPWIPGLQVQLPSITNITGFIASAADMANKANAAAESVTSGVNAAINKVRDTSRISLDSAVDVAAMRITSQTSGSTTTRTGSLDTTRAAIPGSSISAESNAVSHTVVDTIAPPQNFATPTNIIQLSADGMKAFNKMSTDIGASTIKKSFHSATAEPRWMLKGADLFLNTSTAIQSGICDRNSLIKVLSEQISTEMSAMVSVEDKSGIIAQALEKVLGEGMETFIRRIVARIVAFVVNVVCDIFAVPRNPSSFASLSTSGLASTSTAEITGSTSSSNGDSFSLNT